MIRLKQTVIVEGRYDTARLSSPIDANILTTDGFDIFRDKRKLHTIRMLAEKDGIILLTDSDAAGFRIRGYLSGAVPPERVTHVYIPDLFGKERRKAQPSAEGKLGVEGVPTKLLLEAFARAGITPETAEQGASDQAATGETRITQADLVEWGISGGENSFAVRQKLLKKLRLPARMGTKALLKTVNTLYTYEEFLHLVESL